MTSRLRGFQFPFRIDPGTGRVAMSEGDDKLRQNLVQLVLTTAGERVMRRDYGGGLRALLHDPNDDALRTIAAHQISKAIGVYEPRILLHDLVVTQEEATLFVTLRYAVKRTDRPQTVTVPIAGGEASP